LIKDYQAMKKHSSTQDVANDNTLCRRGFIGASGAVAAGLALGTRPVLAAPGANERLSVGLAGAGDRGQHLLKVFFDLGNETRADVTAVCDLWKRNRERGAEQVKKATGREPRQFAHLEELLAAKDLDAVILATPDHGHARQLVQCLQAGKHVYAEKPFANDLEEANTAIDVCRKSDKVVTVGTQRRSHPHYLAAAEVVRSGVLGPIVQVDVVENHSAPFYWRREADVKALREADTDWKAFLMGKPERPFDPRQYVEFRLFREFSTGLLGLWMSHQVDVAHMLTGATFPKSAVAHGATLAWKDYREHGDTVHVVLEYPQGFVFSYAASQISGFGNLGRVLGRQGAMEIETQWRVTLQAAKGAKPAEPKPVEPKDGVQGEMLHLHVRDWLACVHQKKPQTHCTPEHGYSHAIACILADRALHSGRRMTFDPVTRSIREG
jgi:predicted dehydrogenase